MDGSISIGIELRDENFTEALNRLRRTAEQTAVTAFQSLVTSLGYVASAFGRASAAGGAWREQMTAAFSQVATGAAAMGPGLLAAGRSAGMQFASGVMSVDTHGAGQSLARNAIQGFSAGGFYAAGAQAALLAASGLTAGSGMLAVRAKILAQTVSGAFYGGWYSVGYNIAAGIASGIYGGSSAIRWAAVTAAQNALYWAKRYLGIRSPSQVFREEVGKMIPAGIAQGIAAGTQEPQNALRRQSAALVQSARQTVIPAVTRQAGAGGSVLPAAGDREMKISLEAPLYVDGRELARATAKYTGQQLMWEAM